MVTVVSRMLGKNVYAHCFLNGFFFFKSTCTNSSDAVTNITWCSLSYFALLKIFNSGVLVIRLFNSDGRTCILQISGYLLQL